jgi:hypothetical protein
LWNFVAMGFREMTGTAPASAGRLPGRFDLPAHAGDGVAMSAALNRNEPASSDVRPRRRASRAVFPR